MKKIIIPFLLVMSISFISCDTVTHYTTRVSVDRNPTLTIINQTGHQVAVTAPLSRNIDNLARTQFQPADANRSIDVIYRIRQSHFTEQITMNNADATVTLTKRPPTLTVINNTGHQVTLTAPFSQNIANDNRASELINPNQDSNITVAYRIGHVQLSEQAAWNNEDITVTLTKRPPTLTVVNNTGHQVTLTAPFSQNIANGNRTSQLINPTQDRNIAVTYRINQFQFTEQAAWNNTDTTVTLTRRPPTITIENNVGATINTIFMRVPGGSDWIGGNIVMNAGTVHIDAARGAQAGDISRSIIHGDNVRIWMGNVPISGNRFDIRIDDVQGNSYVKRNVQITGDMTFTFTQSDRPR